VHFKKGGYNGRSCVGSTFSLGKLPSLSLSLCNGHKRSRCGRPLSWARSGQQVAVSPCSSFPAHFLLRLPFRIASIVCVGSLFPFCHCYCTQVRFGCFLPLTVTCQLGARATQKWCTETKKAGRSNGKVGSSSPWGQSRISYPTIVECCTLI
jgi:hypothetical protein